MFEHAVCERATVFGMPARDVAHPLDRSVQMRINPGVTRIEPNAEIAVLAPG